MREGYENDPGDWSPDHTRQINNLRLHYPELVHWGGLALGLAWGEFSQNIYAVGWLYEEQLQNPRNPMFLAYIYVRQMRPAYEFDSTGLFFSEIDDLAELQPWLLEGDHSPAWAGPK